MTAPEFLTTRNATLPDMVAMLRHQRARRLDVVAPAAAICAHEGNLVISGAVQQMSRRRGDLRGRDLPAHRGRR